MKITYKEFETYLEMNGYSSNEISHLFNAIKTMDRESRIWVLRWFTYGDLPDTEIEGVTASFLIEQCGYKPLNAFILLDWLKADPQAAKYFILSIPSTISPSESIGEDIIKYIDEKDIRPTEKPVDKREMLTD